MSVSLGHSTARVQKWASHLARSCSSNQDWLQKGADNSGKMCRIYTCT